MKPDLYKIVKENGFIIVLDIFMRDDIDYKLLYDNNLILTLRVAIGGGNIETVKWLIDSLYIAVKYNDKTWFSYS